MSRWLRASEIARLWGRHPETILRWAESGLIRAHRLRGGQWRIDPAQPMPLTTSAVARRVGLSRRTVLRWVKDGRIPARNVNGTWYLLDDSSLWSMMKAAGD